MLLTTSRKPSQRTRSFCQKLKRSMGCPYINRGKMNIQEILQKTIEHGESTLAIVSEKHGNPSKITFYNTRGQQIGYMTINVAIPKKLEAKPTKKIKGPIRNIRILKGLIPFEEDSGWDFWLVKPAYGKYEMIMELYHEKKPTGFKIFIKKIQLED
ncbi:MAG: ribosomal biosynthesis protein [Methanothermobacter sp.]|nr:ribosomal biosynthesis protein [Methanothermobacter sp.]